MQRIRQLLEIKQSQLGQKLELHVVVFAQSSHHLKYQVEMLQRPGFKLRGLYRLYDRYTGQSQPCILVASSLAIAYA